MRRLVAWSSFTIIGLMAASLFLAEAGPALPARAAQLAATPTPAGTVWQARIVSNTAWATPKTGSIIRVSVEGRPGISIELRHEGNVLSAPAGSKPEFGPSAAEFAPIPEGLWTVVVPDLDTGLDVWADGTNLIVVEFAEVPAWQATATAAATPPSPTPLAGVAWTGRIVSEEPSQTSAGGIIRVRVVDQVGLGVGLATPYDLIGSNVTGFKPEEVGPDVTEFVALGAGDYTITPAGLNADLRVILNPFTLLTVEFAPIPATATPTPTPVPPTPRPPTDTPTLSPTPTPFSQWVAAVERRETVGGLWSSVVAQVEGLENVPVNIAAGNFAATCLTGRDSGEGDFACELGGLTAGRYQVSLPEVGLSLPLLVGPAEAVTLGFRRETLPDGPPVWQAELEQNTNSAYGSLEHSSALAVSVEGRVGQVVRLSNVRGFEALCETGTKPEYGPFACEFGGLEPGVYTVSPANIPAAYSLFVDGVGFARVAFTASAAPAMTPTPAATAIVGLGAAPHRSAAGGGALPATATSAPVRQPTPTARPTATPTIAPTPTPAFAWVGRVVEESQNAPGTLAVLALGLKDHPVVVRSGAWQTRGLTGTKPEHGDFAVEFGGLPPGEYVVELAGLAEMTVDMKPGQFVLVEFRYDLAPTPTPAAEKGGWVGTITHNTNSDSPAGGVWSILLVKVHGSQGLPVTIGNDGFSTQCLTGTKPEFGPGACQVGGLWPGLYRVQPEGIPASVEVFLDGQGAATVEFWIQ
ncbi:MAG: hypothetical protein ACE5H9_14705 [Anaerolineae bacterium]